MASTSYRVSLDPILLRWVLTMGYFDDIAPYTEPGDFGDDQIKKFISKLAEKFDAPDLKVIEEAIKGLRTKIGIRNPRARVFQLALDYDIYMAPVGYETFKSTKPKKATAHIVQGLHPVALKDQLKIYLEYMPALKKEWKKFLANIAKPAECIQTGLDSLEKTKAPDKSSGGRADENSQKGSKIKTRSSKSEDESARGANKNMKGDREDAPACPNDEWDEHHYLKDFTKTSLERKKKLYQGYKEKKNADRAAEKAARAAGTNDLHTNSTLSRACFAG